MGADGALRADVITVLRQHGVRVTELKVESLVELSKDDTVEVRRFRHTVSRSVLEGLIRKFGGPTMADFFPPPGGKVH